MQLKLKIRMLIVYTSHIYMETTKKQNWIRTSIKNRSIIQCSAYTFCSTEFTYHLQSSKTEKPEQGKTMSFIDVRQGTFITLILLFNCLE